MSARHLSMATHAPVRLAGSPYAPQRALRGLSPHQWLRVSIPLIGGALGVLGLVLSVKGGHTRTVALVTASWMILTSIGSAASTLSDVEREEN